ncbi:MAG: MFS transporter [Propionibacteriaceae bacterium]|nr:MFS transporter [Propionibacteriaceae bacterium]
MRRYLIAWRTPGVRRFVVPGFIARFPGAMTGIALTLMISGFYGEYTLAGIVTAVHTVAFAVGAPVCGRLIDRFGQTRVGYPLIALFTAAAAGLTAAAWLHAPWPVLAGCAIVTGSTSFPIGPLTRSRWSHVLQNSPILQPAFALESMLDDVAYIVAPTFATVSATLAWPRLGVQPAAGVILLLVLLVGSGSFFLAQRASEPPVADRRRGSAIRYPGVAVVAVVFIGVGLQFGANNITMVAMCEHLGRKAWAGPIMAAGSLASMLGALWYGARPWRSPLWQRFVIGLLFVAGTALLFLVAFEYWSLAVVSFLSGFAISPSFVNGNSLIERLVPSENLTEGLTWIGTALGIGMAAGAGLAGRMVDAHGAHSGYWVLAAGAVLAMLIAVASGRLLSRQPTLRP